MKNNFRLLFFIVLIITLIFSLGAVCAGDYDNSTLKLADSDADLNFDGSNEVVDDYCQNNLKSDSNELKAMNSEIDDTFDEDLSTTADSDSLNSGVASKIYVDYNDGNDDNSGGDWNNAVKTIEKALQCVDEDGVIYVAEGITYLNGSTGSDGININQKVSIIGQNINSVISGSNNKRIFNIGLNAEVFISNVTLTNGNSSDGGAIFIESSSATSYGKLTMSNSIISNCYASSRGGAIYSNMGSIANINNVTFINDRSVSNGGAIAIQQKGSLSDINDCKFINNSASNRGGAIYLGSGSTCTIGNNNLFEKNKASDRYGYGGAIHGANGVSLGTGNVFINNSAEKGGSALSTLNSKEMTGSFCFFINNKGIDDSSIIYGNKIVATFENCYWGNNTPIFDDVVYSQKTWSPENYLIVAISANDSVVSGSEIPITVDLSKNQNGQTIELSSLPKSVPVLFSAVNGNFEVSNTEIVNGVATANYIAKTAGKDNVTVDIYGVISKLSIDVLAKRGTVFVNYTGGSDSNDGAGWSSAVKTISHALEVVGDNNPIYVAEGINYLDELDVNGLLISKNTSIIGIGDNVVIDAKNSGRIFYLDGFTLDLSNLIFANSNVSNANDQRGGVIWANNSLLNIDNCKFINNTAGNGNGYGGAINLKSSTANIRESEFSNNNAGYAGGAINAEINNVLLNITHSIFADNNGGSAGGAIYSYNPVIVDYSIFYNNTLTDKTKKGKSVTQNNDGRLTIKNSILLDGVSSVQVANVSTALLEDNWWGNNNLNKDFSPAINYTNGNVNSYRVFETSISQELVHVGELVTVTTSLSHNQNGEIVGDLVDLPIFIETDLGNIVSNPTTISNELHSIYNATTSGNEVITVKVLGINNDLSFFIKNAIPKIVIDDVVTSWSLGIYPGVTNSFDIKLINNENDSVDNLTIELVSNESDELLGSFAGTINKGISTVSIVDNTIREINEKTVWPGAQNNLIKFDVSLKYDGEIISTFTVDKILAYNGYFNKTYVYGGHDNVINRKYTVNGDIIIATQDVSVYMDQFSRFRNETWNIQTPEDAEIVKVLLYFNYNWDTSFFPNGWKLEFNNHNILEEYVSYETDRGNLGVWGAYDYGLLVFDVTDYYNSNANNSFIINKTGNCALYPSTLYVLYNMTNSTTIKDIYFSDICDVFYPTYNQKGYDDLLKFAVNFNNVDLTNLCEANWYVFTGSSSMNNKLSFNNEIIENPFVNYSPNDCRPFVYNVTNLINQNNEAWFISTINSSTTVAYEQVLIVEKNKIVPSMNVSVEDISVGESAVFSVVLPSDASGTVSVSVDGKSVSGTVSNGKVSVSVAGLVSGSKEASVSYSGDAKYLSKSESETFDVNKIIKDMTVSVDESTVKRVVIGVTGLPSDASGIVTVNVGGKSNSTKVSNGKATVKIYGLADGNQVTHISYSNDDKYDVNPVTTGIDVTKINVTLNVDVNDVNVGEKAVVVVSGLPSDATGTVDVMIDGEKLGSGTISKGKSNISISDLTSGRKTVTVIYSGDSHYYTNSISGEFTVNKINPSMTVDVEDISVGESAVFSVVLPSDASGTVTVVVDGKSVSGSVSRGKTTVSVAGLVSGSKEASVSYSGDVKYLAGSVSKSFVVGKVDPNMSVSVSNVTVGDVAKFGVILPSDVKGNLTVKVDGKEITTISITNGNFNVSLSDLTCGNHSIEFSYSGDDKYESKSVVRSVIAEKKATHIKAASTFTRIANDYYAGERGTYSIGYLLDQNNAPVINRLVQIKANGRVYKLKTDKNGMFKLRISYYKAKKYSYKITFLGDDQYGASSLLAKLKVTKKSTSIKASNKVFKAKTKTKTIKITLKTVKNKYNGKTYLKKGKKITLKVKGKTYTAKTNAKGVAKFTIKLTKKGKYTATIKFSGDKTYKSSTKKIKIKIK